jgi:hypothetical protein
MLRHVALVRIDVSEEPSASIIRVTRVGELGTTFGASFRRNFGSHKTQALFPKHCVLYYLDIRRWIKSRTRVILTISLLP